MGAEAKGPNWHERGGDVAHRERGVIHLDRILI